MSKIVDERQGHAKKNKYQSKGSREQNTILRII